MQLLSRPRILNFSGLKMGPLLPALTPQLRTCGPIVTPLGNVLFISREGPPGPELVGPTQPTGDHPWVERGPGGGGEGYLSDPKFNGTAGCQSPLQCPSLCN